MTLSSRMLPRSVVVTGAIVLIAGRTAVADLLVHLDASVEDSLIDDNGVTTWLDRSGNDLDAIDVGPGGGVSFPGATPFPSGLEGVDFDTTIGRQRLRQPDPFDPQLLFDQSFR